MTFIWPTFLFLLLTLPFVIGAYLALDRRRQQAAARFSALGFTPGAPRRAAFALRRHVAPAFFLLALAVLIVALARPQTLTSLPRLEGTVVLAFDVSASMAATDLEPTRLEAARTAARAFVERQPRSVEIGVVAFSDGGLIVQIPTNDRAAVLSAIDRLEPQQGTSLANGILAALNTIVVANEPPPRQYSELTPEPTPSPTPVPPGTYTSAAVVLLTDGDNTQDPDPFEAAQTAADRGVRIYTVGVGSPAGVDLELDGFTVHTKLDEATLKQIAALTGGSYYNAATETELGAIYDTLDTTLVLEPETLEVTALFAGLSVLILLMGAAFSLAWFGRLP